jgi:hypothetical protein
MPNCSLVGTGSKDKEPRALSVRLYGRRLGVYEMAIIGDVRERDNTQNNEGMGGGCTLEGVVLQHHWLVPIIAQYAH